jgi:hypothetical protein
MDKKMAALCSAAKFREETSKKQTARQSRIAAVHNLAIPHRWSKRVFAMQHCSRQMLIRGQSAADSGGSASGPPVHPIAAWGENALHSGNCVGNLPKS